MDIERLKKVFGMVYAEIKASFFRGAKYCIMGNVATKFLSLLSNGYGRRSTTIITCLSWWLILEKELYIVLKISIMD